MGTRFACFMGWSNTGKTGLIASCAASLRRRGAAVAAIKSVKHGASFNVPGKDSTRFFEACGMAAVVSPAETNAIRQTPETWGREYAESLFPDAEVILIEGHVVEGAVRVLVGGAATSESDLKFPLEDYDVLVTDDQVLAGRAEATGLAVYGTAQAEEFIVRYFIDSRP
jgi:molybdopterin-guanine dinucleotide biosynthesis protein MobB